MNAHLITWYHYHWITEAMQRPLSLALQELNLARYVSDRVQSRKVIDSESVSRKKLVAINSITITILASFQRIIAVLLLFLVKHSLKRIGHMISFTTPCAAALSTIPSARRIEVSFYCYVTPCCG